MRIIMRRHARRATATIIKHMTHALNWDLRARTGPSTVVGKNHYIYIYIYGIVGRQSSLPVITLPQPS